MSRSQIQRDIADAVVWLNHAGVQELFRLLVSGKHDAATATLHRLLPDLHEADLNDPNWREPLLTELEYRLAPAHTDEENPDDVATREVPDYARFAQSDD